MNLAHDIVLMSAWDRKRFVRNLSTIGKAVNAPFEFDKSNHFASYIYPLGITIVDNGNHSTLTGILKAEGNIY